MSMQLQDKQASRPPHVHITMQPPSKITVCSLFNVLVSLQICEIKHKKEWHWPANIKKKFYIYVYAVNLHTRLNLAPLSTY